MNNFWLVFLRVIIVFASVITGFWECVCRALVGQRVCLPANQPEAVRPPCRADRLGRTPGLLTV